MARTKTAKAKTRSINSLIFFTSLKGHEVNLQIFRADAWGGLQVDIGIENPPYLGEINFAPILSCVGRPRSRS